MRYKIEKDIPIPKRTKPFLEKYPFADMEVGDSFAIPLTAAELKDKDKLVLANKRTSSAWTNWRRRHGITIKQKHFCQRTLMDEKVIRVWRIK